MAQFSEHVVAVLEKNFPLGNSTTLDFAVGTSGSIRAFGRLANARGVETGAIKLEFLCLPTNYTTTILLQLYFNN